MATTFAVASDKVDVLHHSACVVILEQINVEDSCATKNIQCETEYDEKHSKRTIFGKKFKKLHGKRQLRILETLQDFNYVILVFQNTNECQPLNFPNPFNSLPPILKQYYSVLYLDLLKTLR